MREIYLARLDSYHQTLRNCRDDLNIRTGRGCRMERLSRAPRAGALDDGLNALIFAGHVEFSAA
jgi:hypothetical protein